MIFKEEGVWINIKTNLIQTDFGDVTFKFTTKNIFLFEKLTTNRSTPTPFLTMPTQSSNSCLKQSARISDLFKSVYEIVPKDSGHFSPMSSENGNTQNIREETETQKLNGFTHLIVSNIESNIAKIFFKFVRTYFPQNNLYHEIFILKIWDWITAALPTLERPNNIFVKCWIKQTTKTANCRSKQSFPLNGECLTQCIITKLYLQHLLTALFTMELLKESSKYDITTIQNHDTNLSCETTKRPHHINVVQNVAIYVCLKKFPLFTLIQTLQ